ncbi:putative phloem protein [Helianthus anomalus]
MFDISKLNIRIKITTQFLSPGVNYGAYIIFKFCDTNKVSSKPMYVNLKYKKGGEKLHAYFAKWRDEKWMMIELYRFLSPVKDIDFEVLLESFSRYHCGNGSVYVKGIEFRAVDNLLDLNEVNRKKHLMLLAMQVSYDSSNAAHFHLQPSSESRFQEVIELLSQHVFHINYKIRSYMLSQDTEYLCYLVFKLSEKCVGLHCPVIVRDLVRRNRNKAEIIYFRSPSPWNIYENNSVPEQREDGWMEVKVWKFNSNQLIYGRMRLNLKLVTYDGTMSGLIVHGLDIRSK